MAVFGKMEKGEKMKELDLLILGAIALCVFVKLDKSKPAGKIGDDGSCCDGCTGGLACDDKLPQNQREPVRLRPTGIATGLGAGGGWHGQRPKNPGRLGTPDTQPYPDGYGRPDTFSFFGQEGGSGDPKVDAHTYWINRKIRDAEREANRRGVPWWSLPIG